MFALFTGCVPADAQTEDELVEREFYVTEINDEIFFAIFNRS